MSSDDDNTRAERTADEEESEYRMALRIEELTAERDDLAARLAAVEALHARRPWRFDVVHFGQMEFPDLCDHCHSPWPCPTAVTLTAASSEAPA